MAAGLGLTAVVLAVAVTVAPLDPTPTRVTQAILLVLPVVAAAVGLGKRASYLAVPVVTVMFSMLIPPLGSPQVHLLEDVVALAVFAAVAATVSTLVGNELEVLGRVERQRRALLRSVSHDLRTPLTTIRAAVSELGHDDVEADPGARLALLELVEDEAERLDRLVGNLLSLGRHEAGAFTPHLEPLDIGEVVRAATERLERLTRHTPLVVVVAPGVPSVAGDFTQLDQLVTNLVENAVRHSPRGAPVRVEVGTEGVSTVVLRVLDAGPGVAAELKPHVFEAFRSGDRPGTSGVGLAICAAVVEGHGGTIAVGDGPGGGAIFTVALPAGDPSRRG